MKEIINSIIQTFKNLLTGRDKLQILEDMATEKLIDLMQTDYFEHTNKDGTTFETRVLRQGSIGWIGENLYKGPSTDIREHVRMWDESPTHKAVLDHDIKYAVILVARKNKDTVYSVMEAGD